ncbi:MAG: hypothetical protein LHV68_09945 [Elusimicrobia bacterium]|nr:hypothetical protein [Candidatus Liberimonas magnetica]
MACKLKYVSNIELKSVYNELSNLLPSRHQIYIAMAKKYQVTSSGIQYRMEKHVREHSIEYQKQYRKEHPTETSKKGRDYNCIYRRKTRHLDFYLPSAFNGNKHLSIEELLTKLAKKTGLNLMPETIEKIVEGFEDKYGLAPITEMNGRYNLNNEYYSKVNVRPYVWLKI